jgi:hypothetical protein
MSESRKEHHVTALRDKLERRTSRLPYVVDFSEEVTAEQVHQMDELVRKEFDTGNWVTVEQES